jgi:gamma-glutamyltranspeptidase/glutathione hydrolase
VLTWNRSPLVRRLRWVVPCLIAACVVSCPGRRGPQGNGPDAAAGEAAVATANPEATAAALAVLEAGGNAADAAVTAALVLAVVQPHSSGLGGGGFLVYRRAGSDRVETLDFRETAPAAIDAAALAAKGDPELLQDGGLAVAVPGEVAGLDEILRRFGSAPLARAIEPARRLAAGGYEIDARLAERLVARKSLLARFPATAAIFLDGGAPRPRGGRLVQRDLAHTMALLASDGPRAFYDGPIAAAMVEEVARQGGVLSRDDLRGYRPVWRAPVEGRYRGLRVVSMGPPSSGGVLLAQMLAVWERLGAAGVQGTPGSTEHLAALAETLRHAFADRIAALGDPDFVDVPVAELTSPAHADRTAAAIRAALGFAAVPPTPAGTAPLTGGDHTSHISVADAAGNLASMTLSINTSFGSGVTVPGFGIVLNDEMDDFSLGLASPNVYGLVGGAANSVEPGKRPLSSMTPTLVFDERGEPFAVLGSPGGPRIVSTVFQVLVALADRGLAARDALALPRLHHQAVPDRLRLESRGFSEETATALVKRGYTVAVEEPWSDAQVLVRRGSSWDAASDARGVGGAAKVRIRARILGSGPGTTAVEAAP